MRWDNFSRSRYLSSDELFEANYCRHDKRGNHTLKKAQGAITVTDLRLLILQLTNVMPLGAHASPKWSVKQPIIVIGDCIPPKKKAFSKISRSNRAGLCNFENDCYFFIEHPNSLQIDCPTDVNWFLWRRGPNGDEQWCYRNPLSTNGQFDPQLSKLMRTINATWGDGSAGHAVEFAQELVTQGSFGKVVVPQNIN